MPIYQKLVNFDQLFYQLPERPIIINDVFDTSESDKSLIQEMILTRYSSDMISLLPSCRCGALKGEYSATVDNKPCEKCNTRVTSSIEDEILPTVWFRRPEGDAVSKLISPIILLMLRERFKKSGYDIIQWLIDKDYRPNVKQPPVITKIVEAGIQKGYNNFVNNFDLIMSFLFSLRDFKLKRKVDYLELLLKTHRDCIFSDYIPLPNKSILILEKTNVGIYVDPTIVIAVNAIETMVSIDRSFRDQSQHVKENRTAKALMKLADFYESFYKSSLAPKEGQFRKHIYGGRTNFSFRAVVSSLTDTHKYDEIHVPWGIGLTAFRPHLINKLMAIGYDLNSAIGFLLGHVEEPHPLLKQLLQELIDESPFKGPLSMIQRNPSLLQGSAQLVRITKFKDDPGDHTVSLSILICTAIKKVLHFRNEVIVFP